MRRRRTEDSLDLLLDTITNTFGGILFLAILVSLLLKTSSRTDPVADDGAPMTPVEQAALEVRIADLKARIDELTVRVADAHPDIVSDTGEERERELAGLLDRLGDTLAERARVSAETVDVQRQIAERQQEQARLEEAVEASRRRLEAAEGELDRQLAESAELGRRRAELETADQPNVIEQTARLPQLRRSTKRQVGIYIRFDKIFMMHEWRQGERIGPNSRDFVVTPGRPQRARPRPDAGIAISQATIDRELRRLLAPFPPSQWVVATVVFEDSFEVFQIVKQVLVQAGYEYHPIPLKRGESVRDWGGVTEAQ